MNGVPGKRRARALPLWSEPCPHEVVSGKSCWCREAPLVELFRRAQSEKRARRMIHPALPGKQDQGPLCEDRSRFGVDFGDHKRVKQHLVCGFRGQKPSVPECDFTPHHTGSACFFTGDFPAFPTQNLNIPRPWTASIPWHSNIATSTNFLVFLPCN